MNSKSLLATLCTPLILASSAMAQGADLCANAQAIAGFGLFSFDNTAAIQDGAPDPLCNYFGLQDVDKDVWFTWVAPSDGIFTVDTCGLTIVDTKIGIYDGSCAGAVLACADDSCGPGAYQTSVSWNALGGNTYLVRLGVYPGAAGGTGQFDLREEVPTTNPATGHNYVVVTNSVSWDVANAAAQAASYNGSPGHLVTVEDQAELDWMLANLVFDRPWIGLFHNTQSPSYLEPANGWEWVTGEPLNFVNWAPGEPNDNSSSGGAEDYCEMFGNGQWNDAELNHLPTSQYIIEFDSGSSGTPYCFGDGTGTSCPCGNDGVAGAGCANSNGPVSGATLAGAGGASLSNDTFSLDVVGVPANKPGLILRGANQLAGTLTGGDGLLCTSGNTARSHVQITSAGGATTYTQFNGAAFGISSYGAGVTTNYQFWYRDPVGSLCGGNFNFTNAVGVNWVP